MDAATLGVAAMVGMSAACLLAGYEFVRSPSSTLFKQAYGREMLPWVMTLGPFVVVAMLWVYGRLLTALGARRTMLVTTLGSAGLIAGSTAALGAGFKPAAWALYVVREGYIVLVLEQYWSLLNSTLRDRQAKWLNGPICGVGSLGAIAGGVLVGGLAKPMGAAALPWIGVGATTVSALFSELAHHIAGPPRDEDAARAEAGRHGSMGLREFVRTPILPPLLCVILATQVVSASLDLAWQEQLDRAIPDVNEQTSYQGNAYAALNAAAGVLQFVVAPALLHTLPAAAIHVTIPLIHLAAIGALLLAPTKTTATTAYVLFKAIDYSVFRAAKELLYIPLSFDARYRAKEVIDVLGYRAGKGGASVIFALSRMPGIHAPAAFVATLVWLALVYPLLKRSRRPDTTLM